MLSSQRWKKGLIALGAGWFLALTLAHGNTPRTDRTKLAETALLAGSEVPPPVRSILQRACQDCHSDNTVWPWYAAVPLISLQIHSDVTRGRAFMNFSKWTEYSDQQRRGFMLAIQAAAQAGIMPPPKYVWLHGSSKLSDADLRILQAWALARAERVRPNPGVNSR